MTTIPGDAVTVSDVYKQNVYDRQDNKALQTAPGYTYDRERGQWMLAKQPS